MIFSHDQMFDIATDVSLIFLAAFLYRELMVWGRAWRLSDVLAGTVFGLVALEKMFHPISVVDGLVFDLRTIPLALAGAYLGWRGALVCMTIAICARFGLGGVGMWAGAISIVLSVATGAIWARAARSDKKRKFRQLLGLAFVSSLSYLSVLALPAQELAWFASHALVPLVLAHVLLVPFGAAIIEHHQNQMREEDRLRAASKTHGNTGLLTLDAFREELAIRETASADLHVRQVLVVRIRHLPWLRAWHAKSDLTQVLGAMRLRIEQTVPGIGSVGFIEPGVLLIPLKLQQLLEWEAVIASVRRCLTETPFQGDAGSSCAVNLDIKMVKPSQIMNSSDVANLAGPKGGWLTRLPKGRLGRVGRTRMFGKHSVGGSASATDEYDRVFSKLSILLDQDTDPKRRKNVA